MTDQIAVEREANAVTTGGGVNRPAVAQAQGPAAMQLDKPLSGQVMPPKRTRKRRVVLPLILLAAVGGGAYFGYRYMTEWQFVVSTDDAYVKADTSIIAAKVSGYIQTVAVTDNDHVKAGDVLAQIDDGDYRIAVESAKDKIATQDATIARIAQQVAAQAATIAQALSQVTSAKADALRASLAFERSNALAKSQYATKATLDQDLADKDRTAAAVIGAEAAVTAAKANLAVLSAQQTEAERTRDELRTALAQAERDLAFTVIKAPFDGVIGNRAAQPGQYVTPGTRLLALVPLQSAYVEANFKETQIGHMLPGQKVDITVDAMPDRPIEGVVESLAPASGSQYSLLPPENATGNFTKIVQRVPVRIRVPQEIAREGGLRPGLSVVAAVHTRDDRLPKPTLWSALGLDRFALFGRAKPQEEAEAAAAVQQQ